MKKHSLLAASVAMALLGAVQQASAANVEVFGFLDQGLTYRYEDGNTGMQGPVGQSKANVLDSAGYVTQQGAGHKFEQGTGNVSTWGIKGSEKLSDNLEAIFHLENGFLPDDGTLYMNNVLFERESSVGFRSKIWGELKGGRMPAMSTGSGTTGLLNSRVNPFGAGWGNMTGGWKFAGTLATARRNNMINYKTPVMNGAQFHFQHSFGNKSDTTEGTSDADRWTAVGFNWTGSRSYIAAVVDWIAAGNSANRLTDKDTWKATVGGHYKFDRFTLYGTAQYLKNTRWIAAMAAWKYGLPEGMSNGQVRSALTAVMNNMFKVEGNFNEKGFLQLGFAGHQPDLSNYYTNNGSLYMTSLVFMPLGLPADHPFWKDAAEPWTSQKAWSGQPFPIDGHHSLRSE